MNILLRPQFAKVEAPVNLHEGLNGRADWKIDGYRLLCDSAHDDLGLFKV